MAHGDYTGQSKARLAQQYAEQQQLAAQSKTLITATVRENFDEVIDLFSDKDFENLEPKANAEDGVVEVDAVDPLYEPATFRASETLDQITVGQGREFNIKEGRMYKAPRWVVQHLDAQGLVYH